jgi:hypothetical protein
MSSLTTWYTPGIEARHDVPGRYCDLYGDKERTDLIGVTDFRPPQYRREVFLRFYEFHLQHRTHPGCVYFLLRKLIEELDLKKEGEYWLAYINGNTQNPITTYQIVKEFRSLNHRSDKLRAWFNENYPDLAFDTDRRYQKKSFLDAVGNYWSIISQKSQRGYFEKLAEQDWKTIFKTVKGFAHFGRLSTWSYLEYLRIIGLNIEPSDLMLRDLSGSKSHRNGLARVLGRDDLDWHDSNPTEFNGKYTNEVMEWLESEAEALLKEARTRAEGKSWSLDVNYFTLESALCTFKSWHRPNRRYPNVYADMLHDRIKVGERNFPKERFDLFWEARLESLPASLRAETTRSYGLCKELQNQYLITGVPANLGYRWRCFREAERAS